MPRRTLWSVISDEFFRLGLRQRAIFALNGEMERLAAIYRRTVPTTEAVTGGRSIYASTDATSNAIETTSSDFVVGEVYYHDRGNGIGNDDINLVWLDTSEPPEGSPPVITPPEFVGAISWTLTALTTNPANKADDCLGAACQMLTLYIRFPYRFNTTTKALEAMFVDDESKLDEITLQTIAARKEQP